MSGAIEPGEVNRLSENALAAAGEYTALAAVVSRQGGEVALQSLAGRCDDPPAFTWWWALARQNADRLASARLLSEQVAVPDELTGAVADHLLGKPTPQERQYISPTSASRAEILRRLDASAPWVVSLAHELLHDSDGRSPDVVQAALAILGASERDEDRVAVLAHADRLPYDRRGPALALLSDPIGVDEAHSIVAAVSDMRGRGAESTEWEPVARLLSRLPLEVTTEFLAGRFSHGTGRRTLLDSGLVRFLGAGKLREVLTGLDQPEVIAELLQRAASELPAEDVSAFSAWAHDRYPSGACAGFRDRLAQGLHASHYRAEERRGEALEGLWASALAGHDADAVADELIVAEDPAELATRAADVDSEPAARQLGTAAAKMLSVDPAQPVDQGRVDRLVTDVARAARTLRPGLRADFFAGLMRTARDTPAMVGVRGELLDTVLEHGDAITAFAAEGGLPVLTTYAARTPAHAAAVMLAARAQLDAVQALVLLGAAPDLPEQRGSLDRPVDPPPAGVDWTTTDQVTYLQVLEVANAWPEAVFGVLARALAALDEPEARHPSAEVLRALLAHAEAHGLAGQLGEDTTTHIRRMIYKQRDAEVLRAACRWIRRLDVDGDGADLDRAQLVLDADVSRAGRQPDLNVLRRDLAERHAQLARDLALDSEQRIAHLQTAATLGPAAARAAAVPLAASPTPGIRLAAARVLAQTSGSPEEHAVLADLAAAEDHADIAELLEAALHRLTSGGTGQALRNLAELLGLALTGLDPDVLIPDERLRDRFVDWVDKTRARSANSHDPGTFIEAAINVADQMVDLALIARHDSGPRVPLKPEQVDALRSNAANRLDVGNLVNQQQLVQQFRWFPIVAALREKRAAHPSRLGSTAPQQFDADDLVAAKRMLRDIAAGWIADMHVSAQRAAASAKPA